MDRPQEFVLRSLEERDVRFVRLWFPDVLGVLKSVAVSPAELESAFTEGLGFDGSAVDGFARVVESDMLIRPDPSTYQLLPWRGEQPGVARMFCDILTPDGEPADADSRHVLRQALRGAADLGFHLLRPPRGGVLPARGRAAPRSGPGAGRQRRLLRPDVPSGSPPTSGADVITVLESMGISVEFSHHEVAPGQQEIDLRYADALSTADNLLTFRHVVKEVALEHGAYATFMPKPFPDQPGSGMHTHLSLFDGDTNAFHDPDGPYQLSATARAFMAGVLRHAPELTAVTNQWVNSYKRLAGVQRADQLREAPAWATWGPHQPQRPAARPGLQARQGEQLPHRGPQPRPRVQPVPGLRRPARGRAVRGPRGPGAAGGDRRRRLAR